jgi:hypothetical protein
MPITGENARPAISGNLKTPVSQLFLTFRN